MEEISPYEVRCSRCQVSFPPDTKRCMHCGGRTVPTYIRVANGLTEGREPIGEAHGHEVLVHPSERAGVEPIGVEQEVEGGRSGLMRSAVTVVWVLLAVGFSILRACSEN
ncbi:MAG: hypothetical protein JRG92_19985 [Deltaproteobacteria bacterium]|nr:hypothetical protein [Deltaproteobacteria bacterium]